MQLHPDTARMLAEARISDLRREATASRLAATVRAANADLGQTHEARPRLRASLARLRLLGVRLLTSVR